MNGNRQAARAALPTDVSVNIEYPDAHHDLVFGPEVEPTAWGLTKLVMAGISPPVTAENGEELCELWHKIYFIIGMALESPETIPVFTPPIAA